MRKTETVAAIGVEIGGTKLQSAVVAPDGGILSRRRGSVDAGAGADRLRVVLAEQVRSLIADWHRDPRFVPLGALGIGFGGPVHRDRGTVAASFHVSGWNGFPLSQWMGDQSGGLPVVLENDSNAAALAEATVGAGRGMRRVFYSNSGSGIGGGFVVDGRLYHSRGPGEMEIGHLRLGIDGGILEDVASGWAIDRRAREEAAAHPVGMIARLSADGPATARHVAAAVAAGDEAAGRILDGAARHYALALSHVVQLLNPDVIVLGGGVAGIGSPWLDRVRGFLADYLMETLRPGPEVRLASLGQDVVPVGAALAALEMR